MLEKLWGDPKDLGKTPPELYLLNSDFYFVALFQVC
jgi:hypothetical protein